MKFHKRLNGGVLDYSGHLWLPISQYKIAICPQEGVEPLPLKQWVVVNESFSSMRPCGQKILGWNWEQTLAPPMSRKYGQFRLINLHAKPTFFGLYVFDQHMVVSPNPTMSHDEVVEIHHLGKGRCRVFYQGIEIQMPFDSTKLNRSHIFLNHDEVVSISEWSINDNWIELWSNHDPFTCHPDLVSGVLPGIDICVGTKNHSLVSFCNSAPTKLKREWKTKEDKGKYNIEEDLTVCVDHYFFLKAKEQT